MPENDALDQLHRIRRRAAGALAVAGVVDLVSAVTPPLRGRLAWLLDAVPLAVPQAAAVAVALSGLGLLRLGRGVRRGQRRAWLVALALLLGSAVLHLAKGIDVEESVVALTVAGYLVVRRRAFRVPSARSRRAPAAGRADRTRADRTRAASAVARYGGDSLAYFSLRDDKRYFFSGETVVAYAVLNGVALVSPDPIGPIGERSAAWAAFRRFADASGWIVAGIGVAEEWLPIYRLSGLRSLYVGDEAVVDCRAFTLEGSRMKSLRQAHNRVGRGGYTVSFHDPARIPPALADRLRGLASESRRGEAERGFSMTLGRAFSPGDTGLLLAVCRDADGEPVAFCQFVPATGIGGYSLDLMRRSVGRHPNGLLDFVLIETIFHLRTEGCRGLALNFATLRAVLAGETGDGISQRSERWLLQRMSGSMQIESLWHFNAKYDPDWRPRYAVYEPRGQLLPSAWAVATAESFVELPIVGRMLAPRPAA